MKQTVLYDESYECNIKLEENNFSIHFDYGTRYNQINMQFSHFHPYYEIYFLLNGNCQHFVEGQSFNLSTYDFVLLKPYKLHRSNYFKYQPCKRLIIGFHLNLLQPIFPNEISLINELFENTQPIYRFNSKQNEQLIDILNQMYKTAKKQDATSRLLIAGLFIQFLDKLIKFGKNNKYFTEQYHDSTVGNTTENKIYEITSYIHQNYNEHLTLETLAKIFYISPHYLSRQFKIITGFTLIQYIQETRIKRAQELLLDTDYKIIEIISICGFGSISQFNRVFSNLVGQSPSKYRKGNRL